MRVVLVAMLLMGCAHSSKARGAQCPEAPKCLTAPVCAWDDALGCQVCQCSEAMIERGSEPPPGQAPFPNH
ncbi:MAG: hypothetical protein IPJ65_07970 [Archangiaceae bacterium]|nr:hypothetical protein [Archangiaceae bacterium]